MSSSEQTTLEKLTEAVLRLELVTAQLLTERKREAWPKSPADLAAMLGNHPKTIGRWITAGQLKAKTVGKTTLISAEMWEEFLAGKPKLKGLTLR